MKILIPVLGFGSSGGMKVLSRLANEAVNHGHEATFVCPSENSKPYYALKVKVIYIGSDGKVINDHQNDVRPVKGWRKIIALYRYLSKNSFAYDAVVANSNLTAYPVWLASASNNFYYIQAYEPEFYNDEKFFKRIILSTAAWLTYLLPLIKIVNSKIYRNYKNIIAEHVVVPGIDLSIYSRKKNILPFETNRRWVIGCIGRLEEWKGSFDVANAIKELYGKGFDIDFRVAFNAIPHIKHKLINPHGDENLAKFYQELDILVAPAHLQLGAIHYPVIEGMACGVPVITTGYEPASKNNSYLVPVKSPSSIANEILTIMRFPQEAQIRANQAYQDVVRFEWAEVSKNFYQIISSYVKC